MTRFHDIFLRPVNLDDIPLRPDNLADNPRHLDNLADSPLRQDRIGDIPLPPTNLSNRLGNPAGGDGGATRSTSHCRVLCWVDVHAIV